MFKSGVVGGWKRDKILLGIFDRLVFVCSSRQRLDRTKLRGRRGDEMHFEEVQLSYDNISLITEAAEEL